MPLKRQEKERNMAKNKPKNQEHDLKTELLERPHPTDVGWGRSKDLNIDAYIMSIQISVIWTG